MTCKCLVRFLSCVLTAWLLTAHSAAAIDNIRVAHHSLSASVVCLILANKEGYHTEEGINVEFLSIRGENVKLARKANEELKASGWKP